MAFRSSKLSKTSSIDWKDECDMKQYGRSLINFEFRSFGYGMLVGCILVTLTYFSISKINSDMLSYPTWNSRSPALLSAIAGSATERFVEKQKNGFGDATLDQVVSKKQEISTAIFDFPSKKNSTIVTKENSDTAGPIIKTIKSNQFEQSDEAVVKERKPLCDFSHSRSEICDINGDARIIGKNLSSVILVTPRGSERNESWQVRPYARKWDKTSLINVRKVNVKTMNAFGVEAPQCTVNHTVPAIIFATTGYVGNYFHDFTDVLVPVFQTARQFNGEVQFVVTNMKPFWIYKYRTYIHKLTHYDIIDYDNDDRVHCFKNVIVGLRSDQDLIIDPSKSPNGYSMVDFMKFMRFTYELERENALRVGEETGKKPRLLIISRMGTRKFMNLNEIVNAAEKLGFEVIVTEANFDIAKFSRIVNSCDVLMGIHGAGLTNFVFLPTNAVVIQVVPLGKLDWIATTYFRNPIKQIKNLSYLEYTISEEESTLIELYPRDDPVLKDPKSIQKLGWQKMGQIYLEKQNVRLNITKFRYVLIEAMKLLYKKD